MDTESISTQKAAFVDDLLDATAGAFTVFTVYLGDRLGYYDALAEDGSLTSEALADRTGTHERYAREWLEQQTVGGILAVDDERAGPLERRYSLPPGHVEALTDRDSLDYLAPLVQLVAGAVHPLGAVVDAYRTGEGVPFEAYGPDLREGQARMNRSAFLQSLGGEWLPTMSDVDARLRADEPARAADVGCGAGWSCVGIARSYPNVRVDGFDLDEASVELASENVASAGLDERVTIHHRDAGDPDLAGDYDLVTAFECVHDLSDPVGVLETMRRLARPDGTVLVMDERVGDEFSAEGDEFEWMMYGWSVLHCLPVGLAERPSAATGTVMRTDTLREYAEQAGFERFELLPIDHPFFRFYRLGP